jgi:hypothetical protein
MIAVTPTSAPKPANQRFFDVFRNGRECLPISGAPDVPDADPGERCPTPGRKTLGVL